MTWRLGAAVLVLASAMGCAKGGDETTDDVTSSTTAGGAGGEAGAGGGLGGEGGEGGMAPMPIPCESPDDVPCKLTAPQCGCLPDDERCRVGATGLRECAPNGDKLPLEFCASDCTAGFQCVNNGTTGFTGFCHQLCLLDTDCNTPTSGPGGICVLPLTNGGGTVCSQNCDVVSNTGCKEANANLKCDIGRESIGQQRWFTRCVGSGTKLQDEVCTSISQCSPGSSCIPVEGDSVYHCLNWCMNPSSGGVCPQGSSHACTGFVTPLIIGSIEYGACVPLP